MQARLELEELESRCLPSYFLFGFYGGHFGRGLTTRPVALPPAHVKPPAPVVVITQLTPNPQYPSALPPTLLPPTPPPVVTPTLPPGTIAPAILNLNWQPVSGAASYIVRITDAYNNAVLMKPVNDTSTTINPLTEFSTYTPNMKYNVSIMAFNQYGSQIALETANVLNFVN